MFPILAMFGRFIFEDLNHKTCQQSFCRVTIIATEGNVRLNGSDTDAEHFIRCLKPKRHWPVEIQQPLRFDFKVSSYASRYACVIALWYESVAHISQSLRVAFQML